MSLVKRLEDELGSMAALFAEQRRAGVDMVDFEKDEASDVCRKIKRLRDLDAASAPGLTKN